MTEKTGYHTVVCPNCKHAINIPYWKNVEVMSAEEIDNEMIEAYRKLLEAGTITDFLGLNK